MNFPKFRKRTIRTVIVMCIAAAIILATVKCIQYRFIMKNGVYLPILMYHHIVADESELVEYAVTLRKFEEDMRFFMDKGYTAVTFDDLIEYANRAKPLAKKPLIITFDDGYYSNYELAYPILDRLNVKASINVIGEYLDSPDAGYLPPYITWEQAGVMQKSGWIDIQCHSYAMHADTPEYTGIVKKNGEYSDSDIEAIYADTVRVQTLINEKTGGVGKVFAYPYGAYDETVAEILKSAGIEVTLTTDWGINYIKKGGSLYELNRFNMDEWMSAAELLRTIEIYTIKSIIFG